MLVHTPYNTGNPEAMKIEALLLQLDNEVEIYLPNGQIETGILRDIDILAGSMVDMTVEIDDIHKTLFYVNHNPAISGSVVQEFRLG